MLLINTEVRKSPIAGRGLFTKQDLNRGQIIWKQTTVDMQISPEFHETLRAVNLHEWLETYATTNKKGEWFLDADETRYMNHEETPSVVFIGDYGISMRDLYVGEELTCNYKSITTQEHYKQLLGL